MQMLYNSNSYSVLHIDVPAEEGVSTLAREGYEIVDKRLRKDIFIEGEVAESFKLGVKALADTNPSEEDFDEYIGRFTALSQQPLILH
jgi:hypothetical protein